MKLVNHRRLNTSRNIAISALAMTNAGGIVYSETIEVNKNVGFTSILLNESHGGASGNINVYIQYSFDGVNFYEAYSTAAAALTVDPHIVDGLSNAIRFVELTPRMAPFCRFSFSPVADSVMTVDIAIQEEM